MHRTPLALILASLAAPTSLAQLQVVERVSVSSTGAESTKGAGSLLDMSKDGRYVAFISQSSGLAAGDTNSTFDVFRHDRETGTTILCSGDATGTTGWLPSTDPSISADGRYVAFVTENALIASDTNGEHDVYLFDAQAGTVELVSVDAGGGPADERSLGPDLNADASIVAFTSYATDLVAGDTNGEPDAYLRDRTTGTTTRVSLAPGGVQADDYCVNPRLNAAGDLVLFESAASNLVPQTTSGDRAVYLADLTAGTLELVSLAHHGQAVNGTCYASGFTDDGSQVVFYSLAQVLTPGAVPFGYHVYLRDRTAGTTTLASVDSHGQPATGQYATITGDGRYLAWRSTAAAIGLPLINPQFSTWVVSDRVAGVTELVSGRSDGRYGNGPVMDQPLALSADGRYVAYVSEASDLIGVDTNGDPDAFVLDRRRGGMELELVGSLAGAPTQILIDGGTPTSVTALVWGVGAPGIQGSAFGLLAMPAAPSFLLLGLDGLGSLDLSIPLPAAFAGIDLWAQGIDLSTGLLSNPRLLQIH